MSKTKTKPETNSEIQEVKKPKKHRVRKFFLGLLCVIVAFVLITTLVTVIGLNANLNKAKSFKAVQYDTELPEFENYDEGMWNIYTDRELKVLQLTDVHIGGGWMSIKKDSMAINTVAALISAEKPDFVIVTGDISYPVPFQAGTFNNKSAAKIFANLMESLGVYWTVCYGNHDTEAYSYYSREDLTEFYASDKFPHCLMQAGPEDVDGVGNQVFSVVNSDNITTRALVMLDSHSYVDGDYFGILWKYDNIHDNQVAWYKQVVEDINERNASLLEEYAQTNEAVAQKYSDLETVKTSLFFHIPLVEYQDAWNEFKDNGYKDTENVKYNYGTIGEKGELIYPGIHSDDLFETMLETKSGDSVFCGHDHLNNLSVNYKGIDLTYGMSIDYLAYSGIYKLGSQRGCGVLLINPDDGALKAYHENYYQDKYLSQYAKEEVTMQTLNENFD